MAATLRGCGNATTGTIKLVDGTTVYITLASGDIATVKTSASTTVRAEQSVKLNDLKVGQTVSVQGTTGSDGIITATTVTAQK
jgi:Cu/Ag efflux protein CusF